MPRGKVQRPPVEVILDLVLQGSRVRHRLWLLAPPGPAAQYLLKAWRHGWSTRPPPWPGIVRTRDRRFGYCVRRRCVHMLPECGVLLPECARFRSWSSSGSCDGPWFFQTEYDIRRLLLLSNWTQAKPAGASPFAKLRAGFPGGRLPPTRLCKEVLHCQWDAVEVAL